MNLIELDEKVIKWATERNLHTADPKKQMLKLFEEVGEISNGMAKGRTNEIYDGIGDVKVVLTILKEQLKNDDGHEFKREDAILFSLMFNIGMLAREIMFETEKREIFQRIKRIENGLDVISKEFDTTLEHCTEMAYDEIKGRTGQMVNGVFIKQSDLEG